MASVSKADFKLLVFFFVACASAVSISGRQFVVGGAAGWVVPSGEANETYNDWAVRNRFQVGDSLYFKYSDDSVLVVDSDSYNGCDTSNPIVEFDDGNTVFVFDHHGYFYFISGAASHCQSGQKLIVEVMGQRAASGPELAPQPYSGAGESIPASGPPASGRGGGGDEGGESDDGGGGGASGSDRVAISAASALAAILGIFFASASL